MSGYDSRQTTFCSCLSPQRKMKTGTLNENASFVDGRAFLILVEGSNKQTFNSNFFKMLAVNTHKNKHENLPKHLKIRRLQYEYIKIFYSVSCAIEDLSRIYQKINAGRKTNNLYPREIYIRL